MATTIERPAPSDTAGRPAILKLTTREGTLSVHVQREDRTLYLFAIGPSGGDRGMVVFAARRASDVLDWTSAGEGRANSGGGMLVWGEFTGDGSRKLMVHAAGRRRPWAITLDPPAITTLIECLDAWAAAVGAAPR